MVLTWLDMDTDLAAIFNGLRRFPDEGEQRATVEDEQLATVEDEQLATVEEEQPELGDTDSLSGRAGPASSGELGTIEPPTLGAPFPSLAWRVYLSDPSW